MNWWHKLKQNTLARIGATILIVFYLTAIFADFVAPYSPYASQENGSLLPPTEIHWSDGRGLTTPFVYPTTQGITNIETGDRLLIVDRDNPTAIGFFVKGFSYNLFEISGSPDKWHCDLTEHSITTATGVFTQTSQKRLL